PPARSSAAWSSARAPLSGSVVKRPTASIGTPSAMPSRQSPATARAESLPSTSPSDRYDTRTHALVRTWSRSNVAMNAAATAAETKMVGKVTYCANAAPPAIPNAACTMGMLDEAVIHRAAEWLRGSDHEFLTGNGLQPRRSLRALRTG